MMFRSDKQRRAMFANMFSTIPKGNCNNRFALYLSSSDDASAISNIKSTKYPSVDVSVYNKDKTAIDAVMGLSEDNERNLAGINKVSTTYGNLDMSRYKILPDGAYDYLYNDIHISPLVENSFGDSIFTTPEISRSVVEHELLHHIDDELTLEDYSKDKKKFEDFANLADDFELIEGLVELEDSRKNSGDISPKSVVDKNEEYRNLLERYYFANRLKDETTPTFEELEEYANKYSKDEFGFVDSLSGEPKGKFRIFAKQLDGTVGITAWYISKESYDALVDNIKKSGGEIIKVEKEGELEF